MSLARTEGWFYQSPQTRAWLGMCFVAGTRGSLERMPAPWSPSPSCCCFPVSAGDPDCWFCPLALATIRLWAMPGLGTSPCLRKVVQALSPQLGCTPTHRMARGGRWRAQGGEGLTPSASALAPSELQASVCSFSCVALWEATVSSQLQGPRAHPCSCSRPTGSLQPLTLPQRAPVNIEKL